MTVTVTKEKVGAGWYLLHLPPNRTGYRVLEAQADGPDGMWRVCPYGMPELETYRSSLKGCLALGRAVAAGEMHWPVL